MRVGTAFVTEGRGAVLLLRVRALRGESRLPYNKAYILRGGQKVEITQPHVPVNLKHGEGVLTLSGGGAGVGNPEERDPEAVRLDVKNELVSIEMAENVYKVVIKPGTLEIDPEATRKLRTKA